MKTRNLRLKINIYILYSAGTKRETIRVQTNKFTSWMWRFKTCICIVCTVIFSVQCRILIFSWILSRVIRCISLYEEMSWKASYLSQFHHHVSEDMEETNNCIPQPAVGQRLLVACAWTLTHKHTQSQGCFRRGWWTCMSQSSVHSQIQTPVMTASREPRKLKLIFFVCLSY